MVEKPAQHAGRAELRPIYTRPPMHKCSELAKPHFVASLTTDPHMDKYATLTEGRDWRSYSEVLLGLAW